MSTSRAERLRIAFAGSDRAWDEYSAPLNEALAAAGIVATLSPDLSDPQTADYVVYAPGASVTDFTPFTQARAVLCLWAGVDALVANPTLRQPLTRMVESGLTEGMVEWVTGHVLRHHLGLDAHITGQDGIWRRAVPPVAQHRHVGILGLGALGAACAEALAALKFRVGGWSRSPKSAQNYAAHHGRDGLEKVLATSEILVLLLPLTPATENLVDMAFLSQMPRGAVLLNPGRGALIDDTALLAALDSGQIGHATLDTFRVEPLPADHPFWAHPRVTVTPHIASATRADTAARVIAENIRRAEAGEPLLHLVDRARGY